MKILFKFRMDFAHAGFYNEIYGLKKIAACPYGQLLYDLLVRPKNFRANNEIPSRNEMKLNRF